MIKNKKRIRLLTAALITAILLNTLALFAFASESQEVFVDKSRYMTDKIYVSSSTVSLDDNGCAVMTLSGAEASASMNVDTGLVSSGDNSLRIVINNASLSSSMTVEYTYKNSEKVSGEVHEIKILKGNGNVEYIVPVSALSSIDSLKLTFNGAESGKITILSVGSISYYNDSRTYYGKINESEYDVESGEVTLSGSIDWETVSKNGGAKIAVYKLSQSGTADSVTGYDSPIFDCAISLNFNISFKLEKAMDICSKYFVAVITKDGDILPVSPEFYLKLKSSSDTQLTNDGSFKAIETSMYAGAIECGSSAAFVDVYLDRFPSVGENGFQYIVDGVEYYIDSTYISELDEQIKAYFASGTDVYFRLLIGDAGYEKLFFTSDVTGNAEYYAIDIDNSEVFAKLFAYTEYVVSRYASDENGRLKGIVLGRSLDVSEKYNYTGQELPLNAYSEKLAKTCAVLRNILDKNCKGAELVIPVSDADFGADKTVAQSIKSGVYAVDRLLDSTMLYLKQYGTNVKNIYFMMESDVSPIENDVNEEGDGVAGSERSLITDPKEQALLNCLRFEKMVSKLSHEYLLLPDRYIYCWYPTFKSPANNYIYNYNIAASLKSVKLFVVSTVEFYEDELYGERELFTAVRNTYKYADTEKNAEVSKEALIKLYLNSWNDLIDGFSQSATARRALLEQELKHAVPDAVKGSYKMWDFSSTGVSLGWEALYGCDRVVVQSVADHSPRTLVASVPHVARDDIGAEYGTIVYTQGNTLKVDRISGLSFDVFIPQSDEEKIYEIVITVSSDDEEIESSGVVFSGDDSTLYADIESLDVIRAIKISARDLNPSGDDKAESFELCINGISIHSSKYTDEELENAVLSGAMEDDLFDENQKFYQSRALKITAIVTAISVAFVVICMCIHYLVRKNRIK